MQFDEMNKTNSEPSQNTNIHESAGGVVFFENDETHELFVALVYKNGKYFIPKGHIEKGEEPYMAAIREIQEELSIVETPEIISFLNVDSYSFVLNDTNVTHYKKVHYFVFRLKKKVEVKPKIDEGFEAAKWVSFDEAVEKISYDRENLLRARQYFYYNKPIKFYDTLNDIRSLTIAIPTYNGAPTITKTLESLIENLKEINDSIKKEIIICKDHCTDNTDSVLSCFIEGIKLNSISFSILDNEGPKGKSIALNKIFTYSSRDLFCIIDDDVILEKKSLITQIETLIKYDSLRCVFASWKRLPIKSRNPCKMFWHWTLGIKFEIQPYKKPSEMMRGATMMLRSDNFVYLPKVLNEDQFLQYIYWPLTKEVKSSLIYFNSVSSLIEYYERFMRIMVGTKQMTKHFTKERLAECTGALYQKLDYSRILYLPWKLKGPFLFYRFIRFFIKMFVKFKIRFIDDYQWLRYKQN